MARGLLILQNPPQTLSKLICIPAQTHIIILWTHLKLCRNMILFQPPLRQLYNFMDTPQALKECQEGCQLLKPLKLYRNK
jgi:hypothetical protein